MKITSNYQISYKYFYKFETNKEFKWSLGINPQYWYQVTGCCKSTFDDSDNDLSEVCPPINTNQDCSTNKSQYFQVILAKSVEDVCQTLKDNNWNWKICDMKRWSRPAENIYADPLDDCNQLVEVAWQDVADCFDLNIEQSFLEMWNFSMHVNPSNPSPSPLINNNLQNLTEVRRNDVNVFINETMLFDMTVEVIDLIFSETLYSQYSPTINDVIVSCKNCSGLSNILYLDNNLNNLNYFSSFIYKNDYELSDELPLIYNKTTNLWSSLINFKDKYNSDYWRILVNFGCSGELNSDFYYWRFSLNFSRTTGSKKADTRLLVSVPSDFICKYSQDYILNFEYNLYTKYLFINYESYYDNFYFIDEIGIFDSSYWEDNPKLRINITQDKIKKRLNKKTIVL